MAHFEIQGKRISKQKQSVLKNQRLDVGLWGPLNTFVKPAQEIEVVAIPSSAAKIERSKMPIAHNVRKWQITGLNSVMIKIEAKAGHQTWDSFDLDVNPASYRFLTKEKQQFIENMAREGKAIAARYGYPLSAMIACACSESAFGTGNIFRRTGCPFNLQKPDHWQYPKCETEKHSTENKPGEKAKPAPFCKAKSLSEAARLWCEWIAHFPTQSSRNQLLALRHNPKMFAENLFLVAFADSNKNATKEFGKVLDQFELRRYD